MFEYSEIAIILVTVIGGISLVVLLTSQLRRSSNKLANALTKDEHAEIEKEHKERHERIQFVMDKFENAQAELHDRMSRDYVKIVNHDKDIKRIEDKIDVIIARLDRYMEMK